MRRSLKFALRFANTGKREGLNRLWERYQSAVNAFVVNQEITGEAEWRDCKVDLGTGFKQAALRQAIGLFKSSKKDRLPILTNPSMILNLNFIKAEKSKNSFDYWIKISTLNKGKRLAFPIKSYAHANKYFNEWELADGGRLLRNKKGDWFIQLTFKKSKPKNTAKENKGLDIGYRKLIADSDGATYGTEIRALIGKAVRKKQGSRADKRVREEIKNYIGYTAKQAVDGKANIAIENLKGLKKDKKGKWSKSINRKFSYWFYALALQRIRDRCEVVGVQCRAVPPQYTSQTCPMCGHIEASNRRGEKFKCLLCGFLGDADHVGAMNIRQCGFAQEAP